MVQGVHGADLRIQWATLSGGARKLRSARSMLAISALTTFSSGARRRVTEATPGAGKQRRASAEVPCACIGCCLIHGSHWGVSVPGLRSPPAGRAHAGPSARS